MNTAKNCEHLSILIIFHFYQLSHSALYLLTLIVMTLGNTRPTLVRKKAVFVSVPHKQTSISIQSRLEQSFCVSKPFDEIIISVNCPSEQTRK